MPEFKFVPKIQKTLHNNITMRRKYKVYGEMNHVHVHCTEGLLPRSNHKCLNFGAQKQPNKEVTKLLKRYFKL